MNLSDRIEAFALLGEFLQSFTQEEKKNDALGCFEEALCKEFSEIIENYHHYNGWFDKANIKRAIEGISKWLERDTLVRFTEKYNFNQNTSSKNVGLILAGNIPLVGFHDFLCVLLSGHKAIIKQSSNDLYLMPFIAKLLIKQNPFFSNHIDFSDRLNNIDAVIATGSNNSSRYFKSYFGHIPHIIRTNRKSMAVLTGNESKEELIGLTNDILLYYGLGCRNISLVFIPPNYNLNLLFEPVFNFFSYLQHHKKYMNNLDYNRAVYSLNKIPFTENGVLMLRNQKELFAPVAVLNYAEYQHLEEVKEFIELNKNNIQCVVGKIEKICNTSLGDAQFPKISNFSDDIDTLQFLKNVE
ncbi:MAG: acyl-CoA reductase [Bacteroidetes bacterium]|nr:acyl-CoA reductase [Flavobacteriales bacterium]NOG95729.1 acyl-CoA reductase [Bacteroidota bacterium]WKZ74118.1 MAG: acyl-CoA reductase [Vicingaceae bacterium]GIK70353.1 MAG: acyl-CoA reductase [Bacteroidota bacterium]